MNPKEAVDVALPKTKDDNGIGGHPLNDPHFGCWEGIWLFIFTPGVCICKVWSCPALSKIKTA